LVVRIDLFKSHKWFPATYIISMRRARTHSVVCDSDEEVRPNSLFYPSLFYMYYLFEYNKTVKFVQEEIFIKYKLYLNKPHISYT